MPTTRRFIAIQTCLLYTSTRAFRITLPLVTPTAFLVFVLAWINAFKIFKEVYFIAGAYPDYSVYTLQNYMNNKMCIRDSSGAMIGNGR